MQMEAHTGAAGKHALFALVLIALTAIHLTLPYTEIILPISRALAHMLPRLMQPCSMIPNNHRNKMCSVMKAILYLPRGLA